MKILEQFKLQDISAARAIVEILKAHNDDFNAKLIECEIERYQERKISIAIVGLNKRGKSTFCNALLGRKDDILAPVNRLPATGVVSKFRKSDEERVVVSFTNGASDKIVEYGAIRDYVTEQNNPENHKNVKDLSIYGNFDIDDDVEIWDLPGDDSVNANHSQIVYEILPYADVIIFMSSADDPMRKAELNLISKIAQSELDKIFFVINKIDMCDDDELADAETHNYTVLSNANIKTQKKLYKISAKQLMNNGVDGELNDFSELLEDIRNFVTSNRENIIRDTFRNFVKNTASATLNAIEMAEETKNLSAQEIEYRIRELQERAAELKEHLNTDLKKFSESWEQMLEEFENELPEIESKVKNRVTGFIKEIPMMSLNDKTRNQLPQKIMEIVESEMSHKSHDFESKIKRLLEELDAKLPSFSKYLSDETYRVKVVNGINSHVGSGIAGTTLLGVSGLLAAPATAVATGAASIPWVGPLLGAVAGAATAPVFALTAPLAAAGTLFLALPVFSWIRGKKRQKTETLVEALAAVDKAFANICNYKIPTLRKDGATLVQSLRTKFEDEKAQLLAELQVQLDARKTNSGLPCSGDFNNQKQLLLDNLAILD